MLGDKLRKVLLSTLALQHRVSAASDQHKRVYTLTACIDAALNLTHVRQQAMPIAPVDLGPCQRSAQFGQAWLQRHGTLESRFINLPMGLPLDTMEEVKTNSSNDTFAAMQVAKNDLLKQLLAAAADLAPGAERIVNLQVQMRRVNESSSVALSDPTVNPFLKKLAF